MQVIEVKQVKRVGGYTCVDSKHLFNVDARDSVQRSWCDGAQLWMGDVLRGKDAGPRAFVAIEHRGVLMWMDAITGTTYTAEGVCTASTQLTLISKTIRRAQEEAADWLCNRDQARDNEADEVEE